jgi:hypothetical protein
MYDISVRTRPWKDSWKERFTRDNDDTVYMYGIPGFRPITDRTRVEELWTFPWMWTKTKVERLQWIHKCFFADIDSLTIQEHMELDAFYSEFDMPARWGLVRIKELDVLNVLALNLAFWTDFNGVMPTDIGLRPDGSLKTCSVQFHNCISSSNDPSDSMHYAPPFKWARSKSPDQVL